MNASKNKTGNWREKLIFSTQNDILHVVDEFSEVGVFIHLVVHQSESITAIRNDIEPIVNERIVNIREIDNKASNIVSIDN